MADGRNYRPWAFGAYIVLLVTIQVGNSLFGTTLTIAIEGALLALTGITAWLAIRSRRRSAVHGRNDRG